MTVVKDPETGLLESRIRRATSLPARRSEPQQLRHLPERREPNPGSLGALGRSFWRTPGELVEGAGTALRFGGSVAKEVGRLPVAPFAIVSEEVPALLTGRPVRSNALSRYAFSGTAPNTRERNIAAVERAVEAASLLPELMTGGTITAGKMGLGSLARFGLQEAPFGGALSALATAREGGSRGDIAKSAITGTLLTGALATGIPLAGRTVAPYLGRLFGRRAGRNVPTSTPPVTRGVRDALDTPPSPGIGQTADIPSGASIPSRTVPEGTATRGVPGPAGAVSDGADDLTLRFPGAPVEEIAPQISMKPGEVVFQEGKIKIEQNTFHGTSGENALSILDEGQINPKISDLDELRERVVSGSKVKDAAAGFGDFVFEIDQSVAFRDAPEEAFKGNTFKGLEVRSDEAVSLDSVKRVWMVMGPNENLDTPVKKLVRIDRFGNTELRTIGTKGEILQKFKDAGFDVGILKERDLFKAPLATAKTTAPEISIPSTLPPRASITVGEQFQNVPSRVPGTRTSKFVTRLDASPEIPPEVTRDISGAYQQITNKQSVDAALARIAREGEQTRLAAVLNRKTDLVDATDTAEALELLSRANKRGDFELASQIVEATTVKATRAGQAVQALSIYGRLTPEGAVTAAQRLVNQAADDVGKKADRLSPEAVEAITKQAGRVQDLLNAGKEGTEEFIEEAAGLQTLIAAQTPSSIGEVASAVQTMAQLLNPKTFIRNILGNVGFNVAENISDVGAAAISKLVGAATGRQSNVLPSIRKQLSGAVEGAQKEISDISKGISTSGMTTRYELPTRKPTFQVFNKKTGKMKNVTGFGQLEKVLGYSLRVPDRMAFQAAYNKTVDDWVRLGYKADDQAVIEAATMEGWRRTFQDKSFMARKLMGLKKFLNGKKNFGVGDFVIKYPKTPGNLFSRGIEYSPAGLIRGLYDIGKSVWGNPQMVRKSFSRTMFIKNAEEGFQRIALQRRGVENVSRGIFGSGLIGAGILLHKYDVITGSSVGRSYKEEQFRRDQGFGEYRVNVDSFKRLLLSGFDGEAAEAKPGDLIINYDWFQPSSMGVVIGADVDANEGGRTGLVGTFIDSVSAASQALVEQPLFTGVRSVIRGAGQSDNQIAGVTKALVKDMPSSFMPTLVNQIRQLVDASDIETWDENIMQEMLNRAMRKLPEPLRGGVKLPDRYTQLGEQREYGTDSVFDTGEAGIAERLFNVFVNPSFVQRANLDPNVQLINDMVEESGTTSAIPQVPSRTFRWQNQSFKLDRFQITEMAEYMGKESNSALNQLRRDKKFIRASDEERLKMVTDEYGRIAEEAKIVPYLDYLGFETKGLNRERAVEDLKKMKKKNKGFSKLSAEEQARVISNNMRLRKKTPRP